MNERSFFLLRMVVWLVLLLAAWAILQYGVHAWAVLRMQQLEPTSTAAVVRILAWDAADMLLAVLAVVSAAGCLMWRPWARRWLRVLAFAIAGYAVLSAVMLFAQWQGTDPAGTALVSGAIDPAVARAIATKTRRILLMGVGMKLLAAPVLAWLGWRLGQRATVLRFDG